MWIAEELKYSRQLPADFIKLKNSLVVSVLHLEQVAGGVASLLLGVVQIHSQAVNLPTKIEIFFI